ncbi:hypothetical protein SDC9_121817 [bioreactor metagenome]|uniref:Uncharacterized protein n=1 Tax=bioreactor metagenome TaxID=1076179 RepID=A0A645CD58_9ZZZZ
MSYGEDGLFLLADAVLFTEYLTAGKRGGKEIRVHPVAQSVDWAADAVALQKLLGIGGGSDDHVAPRIAEFDPSAKQRRQKV